MSENKILSGSANTGVTRQILDYHEKHPRARVKSLQISHVIPKAALIQIQNVGHRIHSRAL